MRARALFHVDSSQVALGEVELPARGPRDVLVRVIASAISPGTERLIFKGDVPETAPLDISISELGGTFRYPFRYGYAVVGEVMEAAEPEIVGQRVFAFHPHQDLILMPAEHLQILPDEVPLERALFLPSMETAVSLVQDAVPLLGERAVIFGQGVVGLLTLGILARIGLSDLVAVDPIALRRRWSMDFGARMALDPDEFLQRQEKILSDEEGYDLAFELSGRPEVLNDAVRSVGMDGRIVAGSWYGTRSAPIALGMEFHRRRQRLLASQVSTIGSPLQLRWNKSRRMALAFEWLERLRPERLITHRFPFDQCQSAFECLSGGPHDALQILLEY